MLCSSVCRCNANSTLWPAPLNQTMITDKMGSSSLLECPLDFLGTYQRDYVIPVMTALEVTFKCAGVCQDPRFFLFSKVNQ